MKLTCQWCKKEFEASRRDTKYCSRSCGAKASRDRKANGINALEHECAKCGQSFIIKDNGFNRRYCYDCMPVTTSKGHEMRKAMKIWALNYKGNKCSICGYNKCSDALEFHHEDPEEKDFSLSDRNLILDWPTIKAELDKCILVCANCHREIHSKESDEKNV